jgi:hypothetical protein
MADTASGIYWRAQSGKRWLSRKEKGNSNEIAIELAAWTESRK